MVTERVRVGVGVSCWSWCAIRPGWPRLPRPLPRLLDARAAERLSLSDDCEGDLERLPGPEGVPQPPLGDEDPDVPELKDAAKLCMLRDLDNLAFRRDRRVT